MYDQQTTTELGGWIVKTDSGAYSWLFDDGSHGGIDDQLRVCPWIFESANTPPFFLLR